jgi:hypothetical protein
MHSILPQAKFSPDFYGHSGATFLAIGFSGSGGAEVLISAISWRFSAAKKLLPEDHTFIFFGSVAPAGSGKICCALRSRYAHTAVAGKFGYRLGGRVQKKGFPLRASRLPVQPSIRPWPERNLRGRDCRVAESYSPSPRPSSLTKYARFELAIITLYSFSL